MFRKCLISKHNFCSVLGSKLNLIMAKKEGKKQHSALSDVSKGATVSWKCCLSLYRWKGENVATTEVAEVLHKFPGIQEANVYGVKVPSKFQCLFEGRS